MPGASRPSYLWTPEGSLFDAGGEAADMAQQLGFQVDAPERDALNVLLAEKSPGKWASLEAGIFCGRQNLKTWSLQMSVIYDCWVRDVKRVTWSAHLYKTTQETFNEIARLVESTDWLSRRIRRVRHAAGEQGFDFTNGATLDFVARSVKSARGLSGDTVVLDEALFLTPSMLGALLPTLSARPNPHAIYASSPGLATSEQARRIRDRGRAGNDPSLCYIEWTSERSPCAQPECLHLPDTPGCVLDDEARWESANPALHRRISIDYVRSERRALEPAEFMRERMGWWEDPPEASDLSIFPATEWDECLDEDAHHREGADLVLAVDVSWDRTMASIAVAEVATSKTRLVQQIAALEPQDVREFLRSRVDRLKPLAIVLQANGAPASTLLQDIETIGVPVKALHGGDMAKAAGHLVDAIRAQQVRHVGQPDLDQAISTAVSRPLGDGWAIDRKKSPTNVAGLVAVSEALWVLDSLIGSADYDVAASVH